MPLPSMEIGKWSPFQRSVPTFQVYNSADLGSTEVRSRAALDPVASEIYVWEPPFGNVRFVSNSVIQWNRLLPVVNFFELPYE
jgi:hypothetical protein